VPNNCLRPLTRSRKMGQYFVFDLESKDGLSSAAGFTRPFLVGVYDGEKFRAFRDRATPMTVDDYWSPGGCIDSFMRWVLTKKHVGLSFYAHNGGRFDFLHLMPWLEAEGYDFTIIPIASSILLLSVVVPGHQKPIRFVDSLKLMPGSLEKLAKSFGVPGKLKHDLDLFEYDSRWESYVKQDCVALYRVIDSFRHLVEHDLGGEVGVTLPATAMKLYRRRYQTLPIERATDSHSMARDAYFGGRTEVYRSHGERLYYYDRNSSYPAAMLEPMPVGRAVWHRGVPTDGMLKSRIGLVSCDVVVPDTLDPPVLPVRHNGRLVFPVGRLSGTWDSSELLYAQSLGCEVVRWGRSCWFSAEPVLREFSLNLQKYRDRTLETWSEGLDFVCKILRNSLYGKFGQHPEREEIGRHGERRKSVKDAEYIIPQIAAHVTALARVALHQQMMQAKLKGGQLYMCDTDSIITDVELNEGLGLGEWKAEYPEYRGRLFGRFLAPKMYYLWGYDMATLCKPDGSAHRFEVQADVDVCVRAKGLERAYKTRSALEELAAGHRLIQQRLEKVGGMARRGFESGPRLLSVPRTWKADPGTKRIWKDDGTSKPLVLNMW
jgi:hypothetical protein